MRQMETETAATAGTAGTARAALTLGGAPRSCDAAPGLTYTQEFLRRESLRWGPVLVAVNGHRLDRAD